MGGVDEAVHGRVDGGCRAAAAVEAVVERRDHLVLAVDAWVDLGERAEAVDAEGGEALLSEGAEVSARALHPHQFDVGASHGILRGALG